MCLFNQKFIPILCFLVIKTNFDNVFDIFIHLPPLTCHHLSPQGEKGCTPPPPPPPLPLLASAAAAAAARRRPRRHRRMPPPLPPPRKLPLKANEPYSFNFCTHFASSTITLFSDLQKIMPRGANFSRGAWKFPQYCRECSPFISNSVGECGRDAFGKVPRQRTHHG